PIRRAHDQNFVSCRHRGLPYCLFVKSERVPALRPSFSLPACYAARLFDAIGAASLPRVRCWLNFQNVAGLTCVACLCPTSHPSCPASCLQVGFTRLAARYYAEVGHARLPVASTPSRHRSRQDVDGTASRPGWPE